MADAKISALTSVTTPLAGTEVLPIVQSSTTKKVTVADLTAGRAVTAAQLDVDNIRLDANTVSTTNTNGNLVLAPNGAGVVKTPYVTLDGVAAPQIYMQNSGTYTLQLLVTGPEARIGSTNNTPVKLITGGTAKITINSADSDVKVETGNLVIGTSGKGIDFSADGQAAGMTSELLDDYEEGAWTPVSADAASGGNVGTAGSAYGTYVKTGNLVFVTCVLVNINTTGLTAGNSFFVQGLPFASFDIPSTTAYYLSGGVLTSSVTISSPVTAYVQDNTSSAATFFDSGGALLVSDLTSTAADFYFSLTYRTA